MDRAATLDQLARLCRNPRDGATPPAIVPSEVPALDSLLPGGGWQSGTIVELMSTTTGIGELRLLMPALARITRERHIALISPPYVPFAPAFAQHGVQLDRLLVINAATLEDTLWAFEQTLRCSSFGAVLAWPAAPKDRQVRRLQLAAEVGRSTGFMYRPLSAARESSPAAVRLCLQRTAAGDLGIDVLKCRGAHSGISITAATKSAGS